MIRAADLAALPHEARADFIARLSPDEAALLPYLWEFWARAEQLLPAGDWVYWLPLGGRGCGKTRTGAETVRRWARTNAHVNIDAAKQAQVLTSYVAAGILTRNEARAQIGAAPVAEPAADELMVTTASGPAPLTRVAAGSTTLGKYNQYHDERGQFATSSGARSVSTAPDMRNHGSDAQVAQAQLAPAIAREIATDAPKLWPYLAPAIAQGVKTLHDLFTAPSNTSDDNAGKPSPAAVEQPKSPSAAAGAPVPNPEDPEEDSRRVDKPDEQTPRRPSYEIGASDGGPGQWAEANENMKPEHAAYQQKATGAPQGRVYNVVNPKASTGVTSFDGYDPAKNALVDAKHWIDWPVDQEFSSASVIGQAQTQIDAAERTKIVWRIASPERALQVRAILKQGGFGSIKVEYFPP